MMPVVEERTPAEVECGFKFDQCTLDLKLGELKRKGVRIRLQDQPLRILLLLLQRRGEVLTRSELQRHLWPAGTFVDFERGLNAAVKRLRAAIGESGTRPRYIETLPRRGYRFIAPVEAINLDQAGRNACGMFARLENSNEPPRVAVLAFDKIGEGAEGSGFPEGLAEELVTELGRIGSDHLKVVARAASDLAQRRGGTIRQVGAALRAAYLIGGAVRQISDRVRVSAQLIETRDETQLWAECYERRCADWLSVQSSLAHEITVSVALAVIEQQEGARPSSARGSASPSDPADGSSDRLR